MTYDPTSNPNALVSSVGSVPSGLQGGGGGGGVGASVEAAILGTLGEKLLNYGLKQSEKVKAKAKEKAEQKALVKYGSLSPADLKKKENSVAKQARAVFFVDAQGEIEVAKTIGRAHGAELANQAALEAQQSLPRGDTAAITAWQTQTGKAIAHSKQLSPSTKAGAIRQLRAVASKMRGQAAVDRSTDRAANAFIAAKKAAIASGVEVIAEGGTAKQTGDAMMATMRDALEGMNMPAAEREKVLQQVQEEGRSMQQIESVRVFTDAGNLQGALKARSRIINRENPSPSTTAKINSLLSTLERRRKTAQENAQAQMFYANKAMTTATKEGNLPLFWQLANDVPHQLQDAFSRQNAATRTLIQNKVDLIEEIFASNNTAQAIQKINARKWNNKEERKVFVNFVENYLTTANSATLAYSFNLGVEEEQQGIDPSNMQVGLSEKDATMIWQLGKRLGRFTGRGSKAANLLTDRQARQSALVLGNALPEDVARFVENLKTKFKSAEMRYAILSDIARGAGAGNGYATTMLSLAATMNSERMTDTDPEYLLAKQVMSGLTKGRELQNEPNQAGINTPAPEQTEYMWEKANKIYGEDSRGAALAVKSMTTIAVGLNFHKNPNPTQYKEIFDMALTGGRELRGFYTPPNKVSRREMIKFENTLKTPYTMEGGERAGTYGLLNILTTGISESALTDDDKKELNKVSENIKHGTIYAVRQDEADYLFVVAGTQSPVFLNIGGQQIPLRVRFPR